MDKIITFNYGDNDSEVLKLLHPGHLTKTAEYSDELNEYLETLGTKDGRSYALVNALGAGEFFGSNKNGDYFPENALEKYHKTFEALAHVYKHHINKDPQKSMGKVVFSHYNPRMKRVELILELDNSKAEGILNKLEGGHLPAVSMGCRVPYDVCSICKNRAKTRADYCSHLTGSMNKVMPDGRRIYAVNTMPKFFDISVVAIPADRTASFLSKVASDNSHDPHNLVRTELSGNIELNNALQKVAALEGKAYMNKKIVGKVDAVIGSKEDKDRVLEPYKLKKDKLLKCSQYPFEEVLSTFMGLNILPHRADFQKLALQDRGMYEEAQKLAESGTTFEVTADTPSVELEGVSLDKFNPELARELLEDVPTLALTKQALVTRGLIKMGREFDYSHQKKDPSFLQKTLFGATPEPDMSAHKNPAVPLGVLATLYYSYSKLLPSTHPASKSKFRKFLTKHPWLLPIMVGAGAVATVQAEDYAFKAMQGHTEKTGAYPAAAVVSIPSSYYFSAVAEEKARRGIPISKKENFVRKHPALVAFLATLGLGRFSKYTSNKLKKFRNRRRSNSGIRKTSGFGNNVPENAVANLVAKMDKAQRDALYQDLVN